MLPSDANAETKHEMSDVLYFFLLLRRHWLFLCLSTIVPTTAVAIFMVNYVDDWYSSSTTFVPPKSSSSLLGGMLGNISSALRDFGLTKVGGRSSGYSHIVILESRRMLDTLVELYNLDSAYDMRSAPRSAVRKTLAGNYNVTLNRQGSYSLSVWDKDPRKAAEIANRALKLGDAFANDIFRREASVNRRLIEERMHQNQINLRRTADSIKWYTKRYRLLAPEEQAEFAFKGLAELQAKIAQQELILGIYARALGEEDPGVQAQKLVLQEMRDREADLVNKPGLAGNFTLDQGGDVMVRYLNLRADYEVYTKLKALLIPMYEQTLLDAQRSIPTMYVVDEAVPADKKGRPFRTLYVGGAFVGCLIFASLLVVLIEKYRTLRQRFPEYFARKKAAQARETAETEEV